MNPDNPSAATEQRDAQEALRILGQDSLVLNVRSKDDFDRAFETFVREKADALFVATDPMLLGDRDAIAAFAARQRIPAIHFVRQYVLGGGPISNRRWIRSRYQLVGFDRCKY